MKTLASAVIFASAVTFLSAAHGAVTCNSPVYASSTSTLSEQELEQRSDTLLEMMRDCKIRINTEIENGGSRSQLQALRLRLEQLGSDFAETNRALIQ